MRSLLAGVRIAPVLPGRGELRSSSGPTGAHHAVDAVGVNRTG
ncbi:hypothetical protein ACFYPN_23785 [Streptomyces sp. NPDC005576]